MDSDRKSTVSSFYGGRKPSLDVLNQDYPPPQARAGGAKPGRDDASSFFNPERSSMDYLTRSSAGYNRNSFAPGGREEPIKGGRDEEEHQREDAWDVYADFNNTGPRYSSAFGVGQNEAAYSQIPAMPSPMLKDEPVNGSKVEMVTVPALGAEWGKDELYQSTKAGKRERKKEKRAQFWKAWNRGERGLCGSFTFNTATPLEKATGSWATAVPTAFAPSVANFSFPAFAAVQVDTNSNFLPIRLSHMSAKVFDTDTNRQVGTGDYSHLTLPAKSFPQLLLPLNFTYLAANSSDQTFTNWYSACKNRGLYPDGKRPSLKFRLVLEMSIRGLPSKRGASLQTPDADYTKVNIFDDGEEYNEIINSDSLVGFQDMHHRTPSAFNRKVSSNVRRRSGGATSLKNRADRAPAGEDDSFPSVRSQPTVAFMSRGDRSARSTVNLDASSARTQREAPPSLPRFEDQGYHVFTSMCTSDEASVSEYSGNSRFINDEVASASAGTALEGVSSGQIASSDTSPSEDPSVCISSEDSRPTDSAEPPSGNTKMMPVATTDPGHSGLIPSIGTTNKFTNKWPKPTTLKSFEVLPKGSKGVFIGAMGTFHTGTPALEKGQGAMTPNNPTPKWSAFKWCLFISIMSVFAYGTMTMITALMTWFNAWEKANVMVVADNDILILMTLSASALLLTASFGIAGIFLNSRKILAIYTFLLWPAFLSILAVGYNSYRRSHLALDRKLDYSWSRFYTSLGRRMIQDALQCCGYFSSMHEATPSKRCYLRTPLPGCKGGLYAFEKSNLGMISKVTFSLAPLHLVNMVVALLSANHVTRVFGKRIIPKQYRLSPNDVKAEAEKLLGPAFVESSYLVEGDDNDSEHKSRG
ncbi:hypothetical protein JR316_0006983 [Psilocybe cubensis]|uniref:Uncharacterized protein n=1 Tax=Psilocybe cubensis TaxID=181762 RepID=A0ACB8GXB6_PSICU|nr:hypothetical protein JR316_0006983 [Psilocybe cubensis]KAH9480385.1 hypothetical protein JR316_0006983 [Psilocybe cubensis]